jgi:cytochrome c-type biogenesis protein
MTAGSLTGLVLLPIGLGLIGFVEPCSLGSTLIVVKHLEGKSSATKLAQVSIFAGTRAVFIGILGMLAVVLGTAFLGLQRGAWIVLGAVYVLLGLLYVMGKVGVLSVSLGPSLARLSDMRGSAGLGVLFGLNIPACAAPLLVALLSAAAAGGAAGGTLMSGFLSLALFGFALSLPLVVAVVFEPARRAIDWLAGLSRRLPFWTGLMLIALGLWSIWFALSPAARTATPMMSM